MPPTLRRIGSICRRGTSLGATLAMILGVIVLLLRTPLERWSYDLCYHARPEARISEVAVVYMDDISHTELKQPYDSAWDRALHAKLVSALTQYGAKAIAFDVLFSGPGTDMAASAALAVCG